MNSPAPHPVKELNVGKPFLLPLQVKPSPYPSRVYVWSADYEFIADPKTQHAAFIVTACNSHDELVAALSELLEAYCEAIASQCDEPQEGQGPIGRARTILAKAGARP